MRDLVDWSGLFSELVVDIAGRLQLVEDFTAMRGVCRPWRAAVPKTAFGAKYGSVPLLMFAGRDDGEERMLYSMSKRKICGTVYNEAKRKSCIGARFGWLVTLGYLGEVSLLNPISHAQIQLPHFRTFPRCENLLRCPFYMCITRAILSANPSDCNDSYMLIVVAANRLGFWRPGNDSWKWVEASFRNPSPAFENLGCCKGIFYAVDYLGNIWALDPSRFHDDDAALRIVVTVPSHLIGFRALYLVESSEGELILVMRDGTIYEMVYMESDGSYGIARDYIHNDLHFDLIKIDVMKGEWEVIHSLDKDAVFIASGNPFCIQPSSGSDDGGIQPNRIYFADDCAGTPHCLGFGRRVGVYHIQYKACELFVNDEPFCPPSCVIESFSPPLFVESSIFLRD